ncbi:MAG TPA: hypothetical protein VD997_06995 [Phycisphaerales bacterium]|nr:hypothetical protein [Phycisphaerales bacterium]
MRTILAALVLAPFALTVAAAPALAQTAFTYQGRLDNAGEPASGPHDLRFRLFHNSTPIGPTLCADNLDVQNGLFTVTLDFSEILTPGFSYFLEVEVRADTGLACADTTGYTVLSPRQPITSAPRAVSALSATSLSAHDGSPNPAVFVDAGGRVGIGTTFPSGPLDVRSGSGSALAVEPVNGDLTFNGGADGFFGFFHTGPSAGRTEFLSSTGVHLSVGNNGNVGVGTTTPAAKFHVANGDILAGAASEEWLFHTRSSTGGDFLQITDRQGGTPQFQRGLVIHSNGGIGIGTTAPASALHVLGEVRLHSSGNFFAVKSPQPDRTLRGQVNANATIDAARSSPGFTVTSSVTGTFVINFTTPFTNPPVIVATPMGACCKAHITQTQTTFATVIVQNVSTGAGTASPFQFIVMGN